MIPVIEREIVHRKGWMVESEITEMIAIAGSAPGGMGVNSAAYIGYHRAGAVGALMAVLGITLPTFAIVFLLSLFYTKFDNNPKIEAALKGVQGAIIALILIAAFKMAKSSLFDKSTYVIAFLALGLLIFTPLHPLFIIAGSIIAGMVIVSAKEQLGLSVRTEKNMTLTPQQELPFPEYYI